VGVGVAPCFPPELFALVDANATGTLQPDQTELLMRGLGCNPSRADVQRTCAYTNTTCCLPSPTTSCLRVRVFLLNVFVWSSWAHGCRGRATAGLVPMDLQTLLTTMPRKRDAPTKEALRDALDKLEGFSQGRLTRAALRHVLTAVRDPLPAADIAEVLRDPDVGAGSDGPINKGGTAAWQRTLSVCLCTHAAACMGTAPPHSHGRGPGLVTEEHPTPRCLCTLFCIRMRKCVRSRPCS
jgi:Ca2+-binding EF-hand superfamily protein